MRMLITTDVLVKPHRSIGGGGLLRLAPALPNKIFNGTNHVTRSTATAAEACQSITSSDDCLQNERAAATTLCTVPFISSACRADGVGVYDVLVPPLSYLVARCDSTTVFVGTKKPHRGLTSEAMEHTLPTFLDGSKPSMNATYN